MRHLIAALMPEPKVQRLLRSAPIASRRRCPLKPWGPAGGNGFWGNPQEGAKQHSHVRGQQPVSNTGEENPKGRRGEF